MLFSIYEVDGTIEVDKFKSNLSIFITPWSIAHFVSGYITQAFGINYLFGFILHTIYEYINYTNNTIKNKWSGQWIGFKKDSIFNSIGDTLFFMLGMFVAKKYNTIYLFIIISIVGFIFYSPHFQNYLTNCRIKYFKRRNRKLKIKNTILDLSKYHFHYYWLIACLIVFIKLKILNKNFKF
jgi:hypothetical protein